MASARSKPAHRPQKAEGQKPKKDTKTDDYLVKFTSGFSAAYEKFIKERKTRERSDNA